MHSVTSATTSLALCPPNIIPAWQLLKHKLIYSWYNLRPVQLRLPGPNGPCLNWSVLNPTIDHQIWHQFWSNMTKPLTKSIQFEHENLIPIQPPQKATTLVHPIQPVRGTSEYVLIGTTPFLLSTTLATVSTTPSPVTFHYQMGFFRDSSLLILMWLEYSSNSLRK
jgi:hypothetical protein